MKKNMLITLFTVCTIVSSCFPSYARGFQREEHGLMKLQGTSFAATKEAAKADCANIFSRDYHAITLNSISSLYYGYGTSDLSILLSEEEAARLQGIVDRCDSFVAEKKQSMVPEGTPKNEIPKSAAAWIAGWMSYDQGIASDLALTKKYQNAWSGFSEGRGVCATYALMFNEILAWIPVDPATGLVNYHCPNPVYLETKHLFNDLHSYSAVKIDGVWHYYDACCYDTSGSDRFLDMDAAVMSDPMYVDPAVFGA